VFLLLFNEFPEGTDGRSDTHSLERGLEKNSPCFLLMKSILEDLDQTFIGGHAFLL
jgi:hypothetical protein